MSTQEDDCKLQGTLQEGSSSLVPQEEDCACRFFDGSNMFVGDWMEDSLYEKIVHHMRSV